MHIDSNLSHVLLHEQENLSRQSAYTQTRALVTPPPSDQDLERIEETKRSAPQDIVEFNGIEIDLDDLNNHDEIDDEDILDVRTTTPREMADLSLDLYIDGSLSYDEYSMLAFQPELHPGYEGTIGALTGDRPDPDRPRDYIAEWEDRFDFERRYPSGNEKTLKQIDRILSVLHSLERPMDFVA
ncbi:hypothetical protein RYZ26_11125 [Terasakiella sp. A23]|uniref:hypothetical protein n=1 Tax=Terasakiella sp. FCG-A23 TaxID=3080561 RepID=UPI0029547FDD|nr:hypothetical protein [Terasakiella sp. A23]MDV7340148.1 hypothetical protein [Terasakiella sp. A23]